MNWGYPTDGDGVRIVFYDAGHGGYLNTVKQIDVTNYSRITVESAFTTKDNYWRYLNIYLATDVATTGMTGKRILQCTSKGTERTTFSADISQETRT